MERLLIPAAIPSVKYLAGEDRFFYNEAYRRSFAASCDEAYLRRLLERREEGSPETTAAVLQESAENQRQPDLVFLLCDQEDRGCVFMFVRLAQLFSTGPGPKLSFYFQDGLLLVSEDCLRRLLLPAFTAAFGLPAERAAAAAAACIEEASRCEELKELVIGSDPKIVQVLKVLRRVAAFDATVLLTGESGVGKNRFADMLHTLSDRRQGPFIAINCSAIPENLLESELFGYEQGAFTGAGKNGKAGLMELADGGTLFLDEIGDLPLSMQAKLLKAIQEKRVTRIGGVEEKKMDFRLVAATNRDLQKLVASGAFRKDLFYRLNVISLEIPPLRERLGDVPRFVAFFTEKYNRKYGKARRFTSQALSLLMGYDWPGNVRELENVVEGAVLTAEGALIQAADLPRTLLNSASLSKGKREGASLKTLLEMTERELLLEAYEKYGTTTGVAKALGISQASASIKLKKYKSGDPGQS